MRPSYFLNVLLCSCVLPDIVVVQDISLQKYMCRWGEHTGYSVFLQVQEQFQSAARYPCHPCCCLGGKRHLNSSARRSQLQDALPCLLVLFCALTRVSSLKFSLSSLSDVFCCVIKQSAFMDAKGLSSGHCLFMWLTVSFSNELEDSFSSTADCRFHM